MLSTDPRHLTDRFGLFSATMLRIAGFALAIVLATAPLATARVIDTDLISSASVGARSLSISQAPDVSGLAGILVDSHGRVLWAREPDAQRPQASITKLMTAVVALEHAQPETLITVDSEATSVGESSSGLRVGDRLPLSVMVPALLVASGNDAAIAIARGVSGDVETFVGLMNDKAAELGLDDTHFANPHGLDASGHRTTAADTAVLVRYAMTFPLIADTVKLKKFTLDYGNRTALLEATNDLLEEYPESLGVKTGFTDAAGWCLAAAAERDGLRLYSVVLGAPDAASRVSDSISLFEWGFAHYRDHTLATPGQTLASVAIVDTLETTVSASVPESVVVPILDYDGPVECSVTLMTLESPVARGDRVGSIVWTQAGNVLASSELVATEDIEEVSFVQRIGIALTRAWRSVFGGPKTAENTVLATVPDIVDPTLEKEQQ